MERTYNESEVQEIVDNYSLLQNSLRELREAQNDSTVILNYYSTMYHHAKTAFAFFDSGTISPELKKGLRIGDLEKELQTFANKGVSLK